MDAHHLDMLKHVPVFAVRSLLNELIEADTNLNGMRGTELIEMVNTTPAMM